MVVKEVKKSLVKLIWYNSPLENYYEWFTINKHEQAIVVPKLLWGLYM